MTGFVSLVGAGPWDPGLLTLAGRDRLARADVVVADYLANPALLAHCRPDAEIFQRTAGPRSGTRLTQSEIHALLLEHARKGRHVVRLKGGDPVLFGRGGEEAAFLREHRIPFEIVPGVPSAIAAAATAGIPVTHRDVTPAVTIVSGYEAFEKLGSPVAWRHLAHAAGTLVFLMGIRNLRTNMERLVASGRDPATPAAAVRWGTRGIQRTVVATVGTLADAVERAGLRAPALVVVGDVVRLREHVAFFERRPLFGRRILVARAEGRAVGLVERLARLGADVVVVPCLRLVPLAPPQGPSPTEVVARIEAAEGIVVSSPEGARRIHAALVEAGRDVRLLGDRIVAAIGTGTAEACLRMGLRPDVTPDRAHSEGLVATLADRGLLGRRWLHVRGSEGRDVLRAAITEAGGSYDLLVAYRSVRPPVSPTLVRSLLPPEQGGEGIDAIFVSSGRTLRNLERTLAEHLGDEAARRLLETTLLFALGPVTADAARAMGLRVEAVASRPTDDDACELLARHLGTTDQGGETSMA
ncbi:MAG: uroporphyrinogen-III C-methyltransferase [Deltaproteobacteria bacterium]|nr:MAG: uroporphyrinogen-III C-methyltransferase [Deltaproteobacteria bacterium]